MTDIIGYILLALICLPMSILIVWFVGGMLGEFARIFL